MDKEGHIDFSDLGEEAKRLADANPDSDPQYLSIV